MRRTLLLVTGCLLYTTACSVASGDVYTLYRNSSTTGGDSMRIHVATFDSKDGEDYNRENCDTARQLFVAQEGVIVRYWCEKGRFQG